MANYVKTVNFAAKDALSTGDPNKVARGTEVDTEFNNIATAIATKEDLTNKNVTNGYCGLNASAQVDDVRLSSNIPRLASSNTFTSVGSNLSWAINIASIQPGIMFNESDAAADNKHWRFYAASEGLRFDVINESASSSNTWLAVERTGATVDSISLSATQVTTNGTTFNVSSTNFTKGGQTVWHAGNDGAGSTLDADLLDGFHASAFPQLNANNVFTSSIQTIQATAPELRFKETDAAVDNSVWRVKVDNESFKLEVVNDAINSSTSFMHVERTGTSINSIDFSSNDSIHLNGNTSIISTAPSLKLTESDQIADEKTAMLQNSSKTFAITFRTDDDATSRTIFQAVRGTGPAVSSITVGNTTDNPTVNFAGTGTFTKNGSTIWHAGNDGAGSGLDADTVDGVQASAFPQLAGTNVFTNTNTFQSSVTFQNQIISTKAGGGNNSGVLVSSTAPCIGLQETEASANNRVWDIVADSERFGIRATNDADSASTAAIEIDRTGITIDEVDLRATSVRYNDREIGYRGGEPNSQSGSTYTLTQGDNGRVVNLTNSGAVTVTVPTLNAGTLITIVKNNTTGNVTINGSGTFLYLAGTGTSGSRTLLPTGVCTLFTADGSNYICSGAGLS